MPRTISSAQTFISKFIIPVAVASSLAFALRSLPLAPVYVPLMALLALTIYWFLGRLKKVTLGPNGLLISNYIRDVRVPFRDVLQVSGSRWINTRQVTITFDRDIGFGTSIIFMPKARFLWPGQEHPIARELRDVVLRSRSDLGMAAL